MNAVRFSHNYKDFQIFQIAQVQSTASNIVIDEKMQKHGVASIAAEDKQCLKNALFSILSELSLKLMRECGNSKITPKNFKSF